MANTYRSADTQIVAFLVFHRQQGTSPSLYSRRELKAETKRGFLACLHALLYQIAVARCICSATAANAKAEVRSVCPSAAPPTSDQVELDKPDTSRVPAAGEAATRFRAIRLASASKRAARYCFHSQPLKTLHLAHVRARVSRSRSCSDCYSVKCSDFGASASLGFEPRKTAFAARGLECGAR